MKYIVIGSDIEKAESWMLHGIYMNRSDAENGALRNARSEITPERYHYSVVEIAEKEVELFRSLPADPVIQAKALVGDVRLEISDHTTETHNTVNFTNVPMERVHAAIAVLNGDTEPDYEFCAAVCLNCNSVDPVTCTGAKGHAGSHHAPGYSWDWDTRTEDFTVRELFPYMFNDGESCNECGAWIPSDEKGKHTTWHNKLLP